MFLVRRPLPGTRVRTGVRGGEPLLPPRIFDVPGERDWNTSPLPLQLVPLLDAVSTQHLHTSAVAVGASRTACEFTFTSPPGRRDGDAPPLLCGKSLDIERGPRSFSPATLPGTGTTFLPFEVRGGNCSSWIVVRPRRTHAQGHAGFLVLHSALSVDAAARVHAAA